MKKDLLLKAIIAFDAITQDVLMSLESDEEPHEVAIQIMEMLEVLGAQLTQMPEPDEAQREYVMNMADIGSRMRMMALCLPMKKDSLGRALSAQREKLKRLKEADILHIVEVGDNQTMH